MGKRSKSFPVIEQFSCCCYVSWDRKRTFKRTKKCFLLILGKLSLTTKFSWTINQRGQCDLRVCACAGVCILEILFSRWKYLVKCLKLSRCCKNMTTLHSSPNKLTRGRFTKQENIWIGRVFQKQSNERLIATRVKKYYAIKEFNYQMVPILLFILWHHFTRLTKRYTMLGLNLETF